MSEPHAANPAEPVCNILIVDDEPSNLLALEAILEPLHQNVVRANSGVEALRHALKMEFCVVLLDVQMPEMDGLETAELLRKRPKTRDVPIIFLTAINKESHWVSRGYEAGAVDYLFKPYDPDTLRAKVATFVDLGKKQMMLRGASQRELADLRRSSDRKYEDLADSMPQVVWTADAQGNLTYKNKRWLEVAGAEDGFKALIHPADYPAFQTKWESAVKIAVSWEAELRIGARYHLVRAVPRFDDQGAVIGWIGTGTDIDARVKADRSLRLLADASQLLNRSLGADANLDLREVLRLALPTFGDGAILDVHADGTADKERICVAAGAAVKLDDPRFDLGPATVGYSGRPEVFLDVRRNESERNPNPSGRGAELLRFLGELGVEAYICVPLTTRDRTIGSLSFVRVGAIDGRGSFEDGDVALAGDLARRIAVAIDNARLHATTERRREELEEANQSKDLFLATLSHELRTPLNAIVGWTDMMRKGQIVGDELKHAMETIDRNALALSGLVADLLDVSRIVTGTLKIETKYATLSSILDAVVAAARPIAKAKDITLEPATKTAHGVVGDAGRLRQVFGNLLSNAMKFTPPGGTVSLKVEDAAIADAAARVRVVVADSGEGIAPDFLPHVFERFKQAETARTRGLGLGLAIVKHLVEEHGGSVHAASGGQGKGSTFTVELPIAAETSGAVSEEQTMQDTGEPDLTGVHVLIVEDDPDGNELICTILERYGAKVTSATTAGAALEALEAERPQVLVSDIGLPDMDGMELIKTVRGRASIAEIPAVALTAYASRQDASKAIGAGFDAHVAKPVQPATLGSAVARLLTSTKPKSTVRSSTAA